MYSLVFARTSNLGLPSNFKYSKTGDFDLTALFTGAFVKNVEKLETEIMQNKTSSKVHFALVFGRAIMVM